jgi:hypothetical protein
MVGVLAESVKGNTFDPRSGQTKRQYNWFDFFFAGAHSALG